MKRILIFGIVLILTGTVFGQIAHDHEYYYQHRSTIGSSIRYVDPIYLFMRDVAGMGLGAGKGNIWYVDSNVAYEGDGKSWTGAKDTLDEAINLASAGDVIYLAQGHTELLGAAADEVDIDVDDLTIVQCGSNTTSNGFDYTGDVTGAFAISGDDVTLINLRFHANVPDVNEAIDLEANATRVSFIGCLFDVETRNTDEFFRCVKQDGANVNQLTVRGCEFRMGGGAAECAIDLIDSDYAKIVGNFFEGDYSVADVNNATTASIHILITGNVIINGTVGGTTGLNAQPCIELLATTSGVISDNYLICNVATPDAAIVGADMWVLNNWYTETEAGVSAPPMWLSTDTALNMFGYDDNDNSYASTNVASNRDGSVLERLEHLNAIVADLAGISEIGDKVVADMDANSVSLQQEKCATTTLTTIVNGNNNLFTISGTVKIVEIVGIVATQIEAKSCLINYNMDPTSPAGDTAFGTDGAALEINGDTVGALYTWNGAIATDLTATDNGVAIGNAAYSGLIVPAGSLELAAVVSTSATGAITFTVRYQPLTPGATIVSNSS